MLIALKAVKLCCRIDGRWYLDILLACLGGEGKRAASYLCANCGMRHSYGRITGSVFTPDAAKIQEIVLYAREKVRKAVAAEQDKVRLALKEFMCEIALEEWCPVCGLDLEINEHAENCAIQNLTGRLTEYIKEQ